ncbi:hypothetical protein ABFX02_08G107000 [Erythranthe guttata]
MANVLEIFTTLNSSVSILSHRRRPRLVCEAAPQISPHQGGAGTTSRNFGRLKMQRIKDIVNESYKKKKQVNNELEDDHQKHESPPSRVPFDDSDLSDEEEVITVKKYTSKALRKSGSGRDASSEFSAASKKRWGDVDPLNSYRSNSYRPMVENDSSKGYKSKATSDFFSRKSFKELGCNDNVIESLRSLQYTRPSHIQAMAFTPVLDEKSCIIADQSGSGKTLAYLLPIVQRLRQEETEGLSRPASGHPRVVILVPTAELATQVLNICRSLSRAGVPFRSMVATGGFKQKTQLESLKQEIDVLIATPGRFMYLVKEGFLHLTDLKRFLLSTTSISLTFQTIRLNLTSYLYFYI